MRLWTLAVVLFLSATAAQAAPVVLISVDGMLPAYYLEADKLGLQIPTLRALMKEGVHATGATSVMPSVTFPAHTTMITGVNPARHGITNNSIFDPEGRTRILREDSSVVFDLPGQRRVIKSIAFQYRSLDRREGKATVLVYGEH